MKRLAVLLAGEFRTWSYCSKYLFRFFKDRAEQVDYFFATWDRSNDLPGKLITDVDVRGPFLENGISPAGISIIPPIGRKVNTFYNQAYLAKVANILKKEHELRNNFVYDQVVETRPDIYIRVHEAPWTMMADYEFCNCNHFKWDNGFHTMEDVYYRSNSFTNDLISNRYWFRKRQNSFVYYPIGGEYIKTWNNHHSLAVEYFTSAGIKFIDHQWDFNGEHLAVRQNAVGVDFDSYATVTELKEKYQTPSSRPQIDLSVPIIWH